MSPESSSSASKVDVLVIGAGPAGLCAALELAKAGRSVVVLEADPVRVGGISRTVEHLGYSFDVGGHRFFSKSAEVNALWREILPDGLVERPRLSRIFYGGKFYSYPLEPLQALRNLGVVESVRSVLSFLYAKAYPVAEPLTFQDWVSNAFGERLFGIFFRTYSEKVWGVPCSTISADWAAQRIKGLDLGAAIKDAFARMIGRAGRPRAKSLITSFLYPRLGPGMMWAAAAARLAERGGSVVMGTRVVGLRHDGAWTVHAEGPSGPVAYAADAVVSTAAIRDLTAMLPRPDPEALSLAYRDYVMVALAYGAPAPFEDNWLYVHDPDVVTGRVQNFGSWSPDMLAAPGTCCLGFEYFCAEGDAVWSMDQDALVALAVADLAKLGFEGLGLPVAMSVVRQPKAYPVYDLGYRARVQRVRERLEREFPTLHLAGRNGMHRYDNQDHAMMTGLVAARNIVAGARLQDPWRVNDDAEYVEDGPVPETFSPPSPQPPSTAGRAIAWPVRVRAARDPRPRPGP